ncbi:hypothetical protein PTTG_00772 [Puccinia triticina 1-1 BBBD Race 1]|uniref:Transcription elongation factor SPT4 n=2 Tax=Puccinia triticina TaxID=208348 RepID=A0A0C4EJ55_PUCT1|nr:uncharacterized protein PtA15_2A276 [Puccinia triticina]OAV94868.1 hypothetical protein PTTG_00772 [Puccinia triticina 1-1 BBBD Race 1]WAQ81963.1 hypothetical protein PtA15_2A276 [Puccinia triticina]WAR52848.1 hypothetical protein PtB15_2B276 [Puccinia triticina]
MAPSSKLRACMVCSFVQSAAGFKKIGCPNCEEFLELKGNPEKIVECTSGTFDGTVAMMNPKESWVAKWQRINSHCPGLYAIRITGTLPEHVLIDLEHKGLGAIARQREDD